MQTHELDQCPPQRVANRRFSPSEPEGLLSLIRDRSNDRNPRVGCAGIVRRGSEILLGKRSKEPNRGLWVLPGGGMKFGETFAETLHRELREEAGIEATIENLFDVFELIALPDEHRIIIYLNARHCSGEPIASSDLSEARFFNPDEIRRMSANNLISQPVQTVLRKAALL